MSESDKSNGLLKSGMPSATAKAAATHRAVHQLIEDGRIFRDPLAVRILGEDNETILRDSDRELRRKMRFFICVRARFCEDSLTAAVRDHGVTQLVVLGAGLDTFAYRNPHPALRVFEVDHPSSQKWKRERLASAGIDVPTSLTFTPIDFEAGESLGDALNTAGFDAQQPSFFAWLGVVPYLTEPAIESTLRYVASLRAAEIVFDYGNPPAQLSESDRAELELRAERVAALGERWLTYYDTAQLSAMLREFGFTELEDLGRQQFVSRYTRATIAAGGAVGDNNNGPHLMRASKLKST